MTLITGFNRRQASSAIRICTPDFPAAQVEPLRTVTGNANAFRKLFKYRQLTTSYGCLNWRKPGLGNRNSGQQYKLPDDNHAMCTYTYYIRRNGLEYT